MPTRRRVVQQLSTALGLSPLCPIYPFPIPQDVYQNLIIRAGKAAAESDRLELLKRALKLPELTAVEKEALQKVISVVEYWANGKALYEQRGGQGKRAARYLHNFFNWTINLDTWVMPKLPTKDPLFPICALYRGRMLIQLVMQHGSLLANEENRTAYYGEARRLLNIAQQAFPDNPTLNMYVGEPVPWQVPFAPDPHAPGWANTQRETLEKLTDILHWWIDHRQLADGQYGGGWGDDVEMWRKWLPVLVAFEDPKVMDAQERLSTGLFAQPHMQGGYTDIMTDVEHTAEDSGDTCTAMMHIQPNDPVWKHRALRIAELMRDSWTGKNERGFLQFKSTYFTSKEVDPDPRKACDTVYHPRAIQPVLLYWQRTNDEAIGELIYAWMDLWVDATARAENGKPAGIIPSAIHWPDGQVGGTTDQWWRPGNHTSDPLYVWPSAMRMMVNVLLLCYHKRGKATYFEPIASMAEIYRKYLANKPDPDTLEEGTEAWCASQMGGFLPDVLTKYRKLSGDTQYDDLLRQSGSGFAQWNLTGDREPLLGQLEGNAHSLAFNRASFMEEARWTDRVFSYHKNYRNDFLETPIPSFDSDFLFSTLTGNVGNALYFPINAVRWLTDSREIAALVTHSSPDSFRAELYHFGRQERQMEAELYLLNPGTYQLKLLTLPEGREVLKKKLDLVEGSRSIVFGLLSRKLCELTIEKWVG